MQSHSRGTYQNPVLSRNLGTFRVINQSLSPQDYIFEQLFSFLHLPFKRSRRTWNWELCKCVRLDKYSLMLNSALMTGKTQKKTGQHKSKDIQRYSLAEESERNSNTFLPLLKNFWIISSAPSLCICTSYAVEICTKYIRTSNNDCKNNLSSQKSYFLFSFIAI